MITITHHAVDRYIERIDGRLDWHQAEAELRSHARVLSIAAPFGCRCVRLSNGAGLVLDETRVVTVINRRQFHVGERAAA